MVSSVSVKSSVSAFSGAVGNVSMEVWVWFSPVSAGSWGFVSCGMPAPSSGVSGAGFEGISGRACDGVAGRASDGVAGGTAGVASDGVAGAISVSSLKESSRIASKSNMDARIPMVTISPVPMRFPS